MDQTESHQADTKILRFRNSERLMHWAIAIPFLVCYATAVIMVVVYNPDPQRPFRDVFSWTHRISAVCLVVFPLLAAIICRRDYRVYFNNIKQAWIWTIEDVKWLALMGLAAINSKIELPEQGKFNAAEKINFMVLVGTYPLYIATGAAIWLTDGAFAPWLIHFAMAVIATPLLAGHIFMATVNPDTKVGLSGMISGYVDRAWAKHHYGRWYRSNFSEPVAATPAASALEYDLDSGPLKARGKFHYELAQLYENTGAFENAISQYEIFISDYRELESAVAELRDAEARLALLRGRVSGQEQESGSVIELAPSS